MNEAPLPAKTPIVKVGIYSLAVNLILVAAKLSLSFLTGSLALRADAFHSLVDVFASIALIIGLRISARKSPNFPYGLYKVENLVSAIISLLLFLTAYEIVAEAVKGSTSVESFGYWILVIVVILILIPLFFSRYELSTGKKYNSPSLIADGSQFRADVLGSSIVFIGLLGQLLGFPLDRIAAGIVALFIVYAAWGLLLSSMRVLLDASVNHDILDKTSSIIKAQPMVGSIDSLVGRNSGRYIFIETTIKVRTTDLNKAHALSERIEQAIKSNVPNVDRVLVHCEPEVKTKLRYIITLSDRGGKLNQEFGTSSYFAIVDIDNRQKTVVSQEIVANPYREFEKGRGIKVAEFLLTYKPDVVISKESLTGKGPGYALDNAGTEVRQTEVNTLDELLPQLANPGEKVNS
ncbi:MAG TPA: cation diffusion facilitator family transporter [Dehalococcoidia bacterium]|nr:cation diffusion facilitator family transporter [Dehalococcoidia bacterium]